MSQTNSKPVLEIDMGNTRCKWRLVLEADSGNVVEPDITELDIVAEGVILTAELGSAGLPVLAAEAEHIGLVRFASVAAAEPSQNLLQMLLASPVPHIQEAITTAAAAGVNNAYAEPRRMGVDRWLALLAARQRQAGTFLVADVGSSLTLDYVDSSGQHMGGFILPGLAMMQQSLLQGTGKVRYQHSELANTEATSWGTNTAEAVEHGSVFMALAAIEKAYAATCGRQTVSEAPCTLYLCGGGAAALALHLQVPFCDVPDLVLDGLRYTASTCHR